MKNLFKGLGKKQLFLVAVPVLVAGASVGVYAVAANNVKESPVASINTVPEEVKVETPKETVPTPKVEEQVAIQQQVEEEPVEEEPVELTIEQMEAQAEALVTDHARSQGWDQNTVTYQALCLLQGTGVVQGLLNEGLSFEQVMNWIDTRFVSGWEEEGRLIKIRYESGTCIQIKYPA